ncbi:MAG: type II toxin-antitoxin system PemK/MazF family toxin [Propionibacteriaceae bacterium]|nr:type II toxin-antitoxin system PemK/MazF family toxin [Propionibacteriaceae bacterium]
MAELWMMPLRRGQIVLVELDPAVGPEQNKTRPCVVVSNDAANAAAARLGYAMITVAPMTSRVQAAPRPYQTSIAPDESGLRVASTVQAEQIRSVSVRRVVRAMGVLSREAMARVDDAVRYQLAL